MAEPEAALPVYEGPFTLENGVDVYIREIRPEDEAAMVAFHTGLSERSVYLRYFHLMRVDERIRHERLARICRGDPSEGLALVAERVLPDRRVIIGVGRLSRNDVLPSEVALLVADDYQGQGLGTELLRRLVRVARALGVHRLLGEMIAENDAMKEVARRVGFTIRPAPGDPQVVHADLDLP
ncbi:MAG: GNAT family N-acetyltransferase [Acidobacteriota bacterium]